jgi:hypothetical protein
MWQQKFHHRLLLSAFSARKCLCIKTRQKKILMAGAFNLHFTSVVMLSATTRPAAGLLYQENQGRFCVLALPR